MNVSVCFCTLQMMDEAPLFLQAFAALELGNPKLAQSSISSMKPSATKDYIQLRSALGSGDTHLMVRAYQSQFQSELFNVH